MASIAAATPANASSLRPLFALRTFDSALYKYDRDGDNLVSRDEWSEFTCEGCVPDSVCLSRSCGDGSEDGCAYTFPNLDVPFRRSPFHVSWVDNVAGDNYLSADEMWKAQCNFMTDLIDVSNMDPHLMLLVFRTPPRQLPTHASRAHPSRTRTRRSRSPPQPHKRAATATATAAATATATATAAATATATVAATAAAYYR
jgi:hypothetical protein